MPKKPKYLLNLKFIDFEQQGDDAVATAVDKSHKTKLYPVTTKKKGSRGETTVQMAKMFRLDGFTNPRVITMIERPPKVGGKTAPHGTPRKGKEGDYIYFSGAKEVGSRVEIYKGTLFLHGDRALKVTKEITTKKEADQGELVEAKEV